MRENIVLHPRRPFCSLPRQNAKVLENELQKQTDVKCDYHAQGMMQIEHAIALP